MTRSSSLRSQTMYNFDPSAEIANSPGEISSSFPLDAATKALRHQYDYEEEESFHFGSSTRRTRSAFTFSQF